MPRHDPLIVRVPLALLESGGSIALLLVEDLGVRGAALSHLSEVFDFKNDEREFARELLRRKRNLWLFRTNQRQFCGDFIVVDMSSPDAARRCVFVLDLKQAAELRRGGGGAGVQFQRAGQAVAEVAARIEIIPPEAAFELLSGSQAALLRFFCAKNI